MSEELQNETKSDKIGDRRRKDGTFGEGNVGNPNGRPKMTEDEKEKERAKKKALQEIIEAYKETLTKALPQISPALILKASVGDVAAIKELNDRVLGKPLQSIEAKIDLNINQILDELDPEE